MGGNIVSGGSGGDGCGGSGMGTNSAFERLRVLVWNLTSYSNIQIVKIAKGFIEIDKESSTLVGVSHKAYLDCLEGCSQAGESRRCLALLYVCNEILVLVPGDESWQVLLAQAMSKYVPLICSLALRQQVCSCTAVPFSPPNSLGRASARLDLAYHCGLHCAPEIVFLFQQQDRQPFVFPRKTGPTSSGVFLRKKIFFVPISQIWGKEDRRSPKNERY